MVAAIGPIAPGGGHVVWGGRHRAAIICRYDCYVTDAGMGPCHGYWKGGVSRIPRDGGGKRWRDSGSAVRL